MKTFAAACLAASATAFDAVSVPDFVAGFIFGMTGDNHLAEIEACYQGGDKIVADSQIAIADFQKHNWLSGIKDAGVVWNEVGSAMTTCKGMTDDVAAIEAWAKIFTEPATLSKTVAKNWLFHGSKIRADITQEETDWTAKSYFNAGKDTASALTLAVGPISGSKYQAINALPSVKGPIEFLAGMVDGLIGENHLDEITTCATDAEAFMPEIEEIVKDIEAGHMLRAATLAKKIAGEVPAMLGACKLMIPQLKALETWATVFEHPKTITEDIAKSMLFHKKQIDTDISTIKTDWNAKQYFQSGKAAADILFIGLGPVPKPTYSLKFDLLSVPEVAAGFVYGMVGENHLSEMEACYAGTQPLWSSLEAALKDVEAFHLIGAMKHLEEFIFHFQVDVAPCTNMGDDIAAIEQWAAIFKQPKTLIPIATKHYLLHKKAVTADIAAIKADWASKGYFATGKAAADLMTIIVGSIEE